jgi:hypothetical protein
MDATIISAILQTGSAGLVLVTVIYFLRYIEKRDKQWQEFFIDMNKQDNAVLAKLENAIEAMKNEIVALRSDFQAHDKMERMWLKDVNDGNKP